MSQNGKRAHSKGMSTSLAAVLAAVAAARTVGCSVGFIADRCCALPVSVARISPIVTCCQRASLGDRIGGDCGRIEVLGSGVACGSHDLVRGAMHRANTGVAMHRC